MLRPRSYGRASMPLVQRGSSLLEVLVAMLLLSLAVLPLASLHARTLQNTRTAQYRATAARLAADWSERMRANRAGVDAGAYDVQMLPVDVRGGPGTALPCADAERCTPREIAANDRLTWLAAARAAALPDMGMTSTREIGLPGAVNVRIGWIQPSLVKSSFLEWNFTAADGACAELAVPADRGDRGDRELQCLGVQVIL